MKNKIGEWIETPNCSNICSVCGGDSDTCEPISNCPHCGSAMRTDYIWPSLDLYRQDTGRDPFESSTPVETNKPANTDRVSSRRPVKAARKMRVLVACEESQAVTIELRKFGHEAYSCDIIDCSGGHPEWHIKQDVLPLLSPSWIHRYSDEPSALGFEFFTTDGRLHWVPGKWDMIIAFPPCTHLAVSGARHFEKKRADGRQREAIEFFCQFLNADCERIAIENPVGVISGDYIQTHFPDLAEKYGLPKKPTQIIQPWMFGHECTKSTCLWLKGLNALTPTNIVGKGTVHTTEGGNRYTDWMKWFTDENGKAISWNDPQTAKLRSKTFPGIARAMAEQWGGAGTI